VCMCGVCIGVRKYDRVFVCVHVCVYARARTSVCVHVCAQNKNAPILTEFREMNMFSGLRSRCRVF